MQFIINLEKIKINKSYYNGNTNYKFSFNDYCVRDNEMNYIVLIILAVLIWYVCSL